jgi:hypothetical protein
MPWETTGKIGWGFWRAGLFFQCDARVFRWLALKTSGRRQGPPSRRYAPASPIEEVPSGKGRPGAIKAVAVCDAPDYLMMRSRLPGLVIDSASLYSPGT